MENEKIPKVFRHMAVCKACSLHRRRTNVVVGCGNYKNAFIMIVGEGPGKDEDRSGLPFVGAAGRKLDEALDDVGIDRNMVYITNVVKCRPTIDGRNRPPSGVEIRKCSSNLDLQIKTIQPKIIVVLGNVALQYFCPELKILSTHGKIQTSKKVTSKIFPIIHPAAGIRNPEWFDLIVADFRLLKSLLDSGDLDRRETVFGPRIIK